MTTVLWVRHGENVANLTRMFSHREFDADLTERGREQVRGLGETLSDSGLDLARMWASPLRRALQTADILGRRLGLSLAGELDEVREVNVGQLDGRSDDDAWLTYDEVLVHWRHGDLDRRFPSGESGRELAARISAALHRVASDSPGPVLIVAHGANIRAALPALTGMTDPGFDLKTATAAQFDVRDHSIRLTSWPGADECGGYRQPLILGAETTWPTSS